MSMEATLPTIRIATIPSHLQPDDRIEALLFDLDGTLVDSFRANLRAYNAVLEPLGVQLSRDWFENRFGLAAPELLHQVQESWDIEFDTSRMVEEKNRAYLASLDEIELFGATSRVLNDQSGSRRVGVVTSGPSATAAPVMRQTRLVGLVDAVVTRDDVAETKPSPEAYLLAARRLSTAPERCLVYEDTDEGVTAGLSAGMDVMDVREVCVPR